MDTKDNYDGKRLLGHYKIQNDVLWDLMTIAQRLCPSGEWFFQVFAHTEYDPQDPRHVKKHFLACVTNGDDNVTAVCSTPGAAVAKLVYHLLDGSVFPLTGNGGIKIFPADNDWTRELEDSDQKEGE